MVTICPSNYKQDESVIRNLIYRYIWPTDSNNIKDLLYTTKNLKQSKMASEEIDPRPHKY